MVIPKADEQNLVYDIRLSSVVPGRVTGLDNTHNLQPIDVAMKLHYLKGLYFFPNNKNNTKNSNTSSEEQEDSSLISIGELKKPMFEWLVSYFMACGRIRLGSDQPEARPVIKLNDAGIRVVEARSDKSVQEWLGMEGFMAMQDQLVYGHALGPDLPFSPLVFIQVTSFKCGGISIGLSWAHILGDVFSASSFMNLLGQYMQGKTAQLLLPPNYVKPEYPLSSNSQEPLSIKRVEPVGDHWVTPNNCKMGTHFFKLSSTKLAQLVSKVYGSNEDEHRMGKHFEVISAIIWKVVAKIRKDCEPMVVTVCRPKSLEREHVIPYNGQVISTVKADFLTSDIDVLQLVSMIAENVVDESGAIQPVVEKDKGKFDYIVYGGNLTFVDMEDVNVYGFKVAGQCPIFASYTIGGVAEGGTVLVLPGAKDENDGGNNGKIVIVTLPEYELEAVKTVLKNEWSIM